MSDDTILLAPCMHCNYHGRGYWQSGTHALECPWYAVGGEEQRWKILNNPISNNSDVTVYDRIKQLETQLAESNKERDAANKRYDEKCNQYIFDMMEKGTQLAESKQIAQELSASLCEIQVAAKLGIEGEPLHKIIFEETETSQQWQPIESAPKGEYVLVYDGGMHVDHMPEITQDFEHMMSNEYGPTHWQPLPAGPERGGAG